MPSHRRATRRADSAAATFDGKVYALPYQGNSMSLFINNKEFRAAGLDPEKDAPKTWEDMIALGPKLKNVQGTRTVQKAFDFPYHSHRWEVQDFQPLVEQFGGKLLSDDGKTAYLNSPAAVKALTLWRDVTKAAGDPETTMNTPSNPNQDFVDGRTAMWITGPWATPQIRQSPIGDDFTVVSLPQVDPAQAAHHGVWLDVGREQGQARRPRRPSPGTSSGSCWRSRTCGSARSASCSRSRAWTQSDVAKNFPFFAVHMKDVSTGSWYLRSEFTNEITQALGRAIERVVYDGADPKASLDQAQAEAERVLKK